MGVPVCGLEVERFLEMRQCFRVLTFFSLATRDPIIRDRQHIPSIRLASKLEYDREMFNSAIEPLGAHSDHAFRHTQRNVFEDRQLCAHVLPVRGDQFFYQIKVAEAEVDPFRQDPEKRSGVLNGGIKRLNDIRATCKQMRTVIDLSRIDVRTKRGQQIGGN
ncbi:MAG TPA: hypothetical protein VN902_08055 [Candidatus Acidoferrales bacterium]|nr:hypothetical protein [Candidatus Acidoferrales bacterium]